MAFLEFLLAAARTGIVAAYVFQGITNGFLRPVVTVWTVNVLLMRSVRMGAVGAMNVWLLRHE
jgi:hypothetical protein